MQTDLSIKSDLGHFLPPTCPGVQESACAGTILQFKEARGQKMFQDTSSSHDQSGFIYSRYPFNIASRDRGV